MTCIMRIDTRHAIYQLARMGSSVCPRVWKAFGTADGTTDGAVSSGFLMQA